MTKDPRQVDLEEWLEATRRSPEVSDLRIEVTTEPVEVFEMDAGRVVFSDSAPGLVTIAVELPHEDARLLTVGPTYDGQWRVVLCDRHGVGVGHVVTGFGPDPLSASRSTHERLLAAIAARVERSAQVAAASGALGRAFTAASGTIPAAAKRARAAPAGVAKPTRAGGSVPYAGSVPRNASQWLVETDGVHVSLHPGLVWPDTGGSEDRVFPTIRIAKDVTRGAVRG